MQKRIVLSIVPIVLLLLGLLSWYTWRTQTNQNQINSDKTETPRNQNIESPTLASLILDDDQTIYFADAISEFEIEQILENNGPYTVFLATDTAYQNIPPETQEAFANYGQRQRPYYRQVILYNIVEGKYTTNDLKDGMSLKTLQGEYITVTRKDNYWILDGYAYIQGGDIEASNGVIHKTTNFLFPPSFFSN